MKILFSPSESKRDGGKFGPISENSFSFKECFEKRVEILNLYNNFLKNSDIKKLCKLFGLKDEKECEKYKIDIFKAKTLKAIQRYTGVAYQYLDYKNLERDSKEFIETNTIIFSNLFGPILAKDFIPDYKLKQGERIDNFNIEKFYNVNCSEILDKFLENEDILDLRAGFYEKFYKPNKKYTKLKFIKDKKVVSHWAKAYRGIVLREIAKEKIDNIDDFMDLKIEGLSILEIKKTKKFDEIVYEIY